VRRSRENEPHARLRKAQIRVRINLRKSRKNYVGERRPVCSAKTLTVDIDCVPFACAIYSENGESRRVKCIYNIYELKIYNFYYDMYRTQSMIALQFEIIGLYIALDRIGIIIQIDYSELNYYRF